MLLIYQILRTKNNEGKRIERYEAAIEFSGRIGGDGSGILVKYPDPNVSFTGAFDVSASKFGGRYVYMDCRCSLKVDDRRET